MRSIRTAQLQTPYSARWSSQMATFVVGNKTGRKQRLKAKTRICLHCLILSSCLVRLKPTIPGDWVENIPVGILIIVSGYNVPLQKASV